MLIVSCLLLLLLLLLLTSPRRSTQYYHPKLGCWVRLYACLSALASGNLLAGGSTRRGGAIGTGDYTGVVAGHA